MCRKTEFIQSLRALGPYHLSVYVNPMGAENMKCISVGMSLLFILAAFSGCLGQEPPSPEDPTISYPSIWDRHTLEWNTSGSYSLVLEPGPYSALEVQEALISVDTSSVWETGPNEAEVHLSYWLPNNTEEGAQVPVIAVVSPYFSYGLQGSESTPTNVVGAGRGEFIFENFILNY